jgi:hypothetical protein
MAKLHRFFRVTQAQEVTLDGITVDLKGVGGPQDITVIDDEPMEEIMTLQFVGEKTPLPKFIQSGKTLGPFRAGDRTRGFEGHGGLSVHNF